MTAVLQAEAQRQANTFGRPFWIVTPNAGPPFITANPAYIPPRYLALFKVLPTDYTSTWTSKTPAY